MERNTLILLGAVVVAVLTAGVLATFGTVGAQENSEAGNHTIEVDGQGAADADPDRALVGTAVIAEGDSPGEVRDELAAGAADLEAALDELGVEYETTDYTIEQPREYEERGLSPYHGVHAFEVTVDDLDATGDVIDAAVDAGAEIEGIKLTVTDETREQLREEAIEKAMADAKSQATTIAENSDLEVVGETSVDASQGHVRPVAIPEEAYVMVDDAADAPATDIQTGDVTVSYSVDIVYDATR